MYSWPDHWAWQSTAHTPELLVRPKFGYWVEEGRAGGTHRAPLW